MNNACPVPFYSQPIVLVLVLELGVRGPSLLANRPADDLLRLHYDGSKMVVTFEAFGVQFVDLLCAGRASREPTAD